MNKIDMLEIRKGSAIRSYENTFFREFALNLKKMFEKYNLDGLLIANSECEKEPRLQIDALLITKNGVCIIDFKNFGGKIYLPTIFNFDFGQWKNENKVLIKGGSYINPYIQLKNQKERFINVVENHILDRLPKSDRFNPYHTGRAVCFQKTIELFGNIPPKDELNFFIIDKANYLEKIKDIIDISDKEVSLTTDSYDIFKKFFRADLFDLSENYGETSDFTSYETELDFEKLYPDQKSALQEIESFLKSKDDRFFVLQGTSLSGKTHLIPFIQDVAYNNLIPEAKLFASSGRVANNLSKNTNLEVDSIYSYIYGGNTTNSETKAKEKEETENQDEDIIDLEVVPLKKSYDTEEAIFIVDESHLISDNYHQSIDLRFGSGKLLKDFIEFADLKNSKRKIIFIGDSYQLLIGKKVESALNPIYLRDKYEFEAKAFQLDDKVKKSPIVAEGLKAVTSIRNQSFNNLKFEISDSLEILSKDRWKEKIEESLNSNSSSHILCFSNFDAQELNFWIKNSIFKNGNDLTKGDLVIFRNNIKVIDENDPFAEPKKIFNGQFGKVVSVSNTITKTEKLITPLTFREVTINLQESNHTLNFLSLENFRLSDKGELSNEEIISYKILLAQLAKEELDNFKNGKYLIDEELEDLFQKLADGKRVKTKVYRKIQRSLSNMPATDYYKFKNAAQLRFGWALTVHKSMFYKWDEIFFNVKTGGGRTNETYFKWIYTGLIRATSKVSLINYTPISPFDKVDLNTTIPVNSNGKYLFYISDTSIDLSNLNKEVTDKYNFKDDNFKSSLLQLHKFIEVKIKSQKISINSINHNNYQELYELKGSSGETATISIYYNKRGQFKMPSLINSQPIEFGEELMGILKADNSISDFNFIEDNWRVLAYSQLNEKLKEKDLTINYIIQTPYKDTLKLNRSTENIVVDLYYDGYGFFSTISALSATNPNLWTDFQTILNELKAS